MKKIIKPFVFLSVIMMTLGLGLYHSVSAMSALADSEKEEKRPIRINISYSNTNDTSRNVVVKLKTYTYEQTESKRKRKIWEPANNVIVNLYLNEITKAGMMGSIATDENGISEFKLVNKFNRARDSVNLFRFTARVINDPIFEDGEEEVEIADAKMDLIAFVKDSIRYLKATVKKVTDDGILVPYEDAEIGFYVKMVFGLLPLTEDNFSTDENGEIVTEIPFDIPGSVEGDINIIASVLDNEELGMLSFKMKKRWGVSHAAYIDKSERALWATSANAPLWLVTTVNSLLIGIWLTILYICYQLFLIRKSGKSTST